MGSKGESFEPGRFSREKQEFEDTLKALRSLREKVRVNILERQRKIDEDTERLKQRKIFVKKQSPFLTGAELATLLDEIGKIEETVANTKAEQQEAWKTLNYNHPQLSDQSFSKLPEGKQTNEILSKIRNAKSIQENFQSNPLDLILKIAEAEHKLQTFLFKNK